jgi:hypothetical protein
MRLAIKQLIIGGAAAIVLVAVVGVFRTFEKDRVMYLSFPLEVSPPPAWVAAIDWVIENLELANIAFNTTLSVQLAESGTIQLLRSTQGLNHA